MKEDRRWTWVVEVCIDETWGGRRWGTTGECAPTRKAAETKARKLQKRRPGEWFRVAKYRPAPERGWAHALGQAVIDRVAGRIAIHLAGRAPRSRVEIMAVKCTAAELAPIIRKELDDA